MATKKKKRESKPRYQLMLARKLWQRPYPPTVVAVRREMLELRDAMLLTRDEVEVLEMLISATERSWQGYLGT